MTAEGDATGVGAEPRGIVNGALGIVLLALQTNPWFSTTSTV